MMDTAHSGQNVEMIQGAHSRRHSPGQGNSDVTGEVEGALGMHIYKGTITNQDCVRIDK